MLHEVKQIHLNYEKYGIEHKAEPATITTYIKEQYPEYQNEFHRPLVIICPGGGYQHLSPREGEAIALKMLTLGYNALILRYSVYPNEFPCALFEAAYTIQYARSHAKEWDVDPDKIIMAGFSAGGHVAASISTMWDGPELAQFIKEDLGTEPRAIRPDGLLLGYPVLTSGEYAHRSSFERLLGERYQELIGSVALENRVNSQTPQTFLWHTVEDGSVPVENSMLFAQALKKADVKFELHIFPNGAHGLGLGSAETDTKDGRHRQPEVEVWPDLFQTWVEINIVGEE